MPKEKGSHHRYSRYSTHTLRPTDHVLNLGLHSNLQETTRTTNWTLVHTITKSNLKWTKKKHSHSSDREDRQTTAGWYTWHTESCNQTLLPLAQTICTTPETEQLINNVLISVIYLLSSPVQWYVVFTNCNPPNNKSSTEFSKFHFFAVNYFRISYAHTLSNIASSFAEPIVSQNKSYKRKNP